jgi:hypothetical protein
MARVYVVYAGFFIKNLHFRPILFQKIINRRLVPLGEELGEKLFTRLTYYTLIKSN